MPADEGLRVFRYQDLRPSGPAIPLEEEFRRNVEAFTQASDVLFVQLPLPA